ncbi:MAG: hypothetical protein KAT90_14260 [Gammaproteobacteria bacterium]|nr:hypothetical protein [Gammaproteobacteria bacterium]
MSTATKKVPKENAAPYNLPCGQASVSNFANASVQLASMLDEPHKSSMACAAIKVEI